MRNQALTIDRVDLQFHLELKKDSSCPLYLTNNTDNFVTFKVIATAPHKYFIRPDTGVILPRSSAAVLVTLKAQTEAPAHMQCEDMFFIQSVVASPGTTAKNLTTEMFSLNDGHLIEKIKLKVRYVAKSIISDNENAYRVAVYKVFINFRGDELRNNFVSFLVKAMRLEKINVFIDEVEDRGTNLNNLFHTIEECRIAVAIFSERYTQSRWCLDELVKMEEQMEKGKLVVIPIFFRLDATTCKRYMGAFGENFRNLEWEYRSEPERVDKWKKALSSVFNNLGFESNILRDESKLADSIVEETKKWLNKISIGAENAKNSTIVV
ncbi:PREDICTED: vesicle-associated protein 1-4 [Camelina sativa]|uniref:Vesicle-associated protein 1-4 n=1 Tax=Camelina sativa TaxID=90675 RepID=A0ABM0SXH6_CAMSA|nr:PREDICTED: vesicle-associated protein 1-4 [Camelina sativa]